MTAAPLNNSAARRLQKQNEKRLHDAASDMLAALKMLREIDDAYGFDLNEQQRDQMHDAIRKAEGRP